MLIMKLLFVIFVVIIPCAYFNVPTFILPALLVAALLWGLLLRCEPTHVEISDIGMRLHFYHAPLKISPQWISWDAISSVGYGNAKAGGLESVKCIDLAIDLNCFSKMDKYVLELFTSLITVRENSKVLPLRLIESGFVHDTDQATFRNMLREHVQIDRISSDLLAREEFGEVPTYTALWLDNLQKTPLALLEKLPPATRLATGSYELLEVLGAGGQSIVYEAIKHGQEGETESCVLKQFVLPVRGGYEIRQRTLENIQREAKLLQTLDNPRIVKFKDLFVEGSLAFLVLAKIDGHSLRQVISETGPMKADNLARTVLEMAELLNYLHSQTPPVVHRDFTPENLMLCSDDHISVIDFNVAQRLESNSTKTVVGKHAYLPPEQFRGKPTVQSDIYALGATAAFLATSEDPEPLTSSNLATKRTDLSKEFVKLIARATEPEASERYATSGELIDELKNLPELNRHNDAVST